MPRKSESERYQLWSDRISLCDRMLKQRYDTWRKYLNHYRQEIPESDKPEGQVLWINYIFQLCRTVLPGLYFQNPDVLADPIGSTPLPFATAAEMILNHTLDEIDFQRECRSTILDALVCGLGVMKFGYLRGLEGETIEDVMASSLFDPDLWLDEEEGRQPYYPDYRIQEALPFAFRVSPRMFLIDPLAGSRFERARWVAHIILRPEEEVRKDTTYTKSIVAGIEGTVGFKDAYPVFAAKTGDGTVVSSEDMVSNRFGNLVKIYEIWDRETNSILVMDEGGVLKGERAKFLREDVNPYDARGFPFEILVFNEDPDEVYGVSDVSTWFNPAVCLNVLNSAQYGHILRTNSRKYGVEQGSFAADEDEAMLESPTNCGIVHFNGPPDGAVYPIPDLPIPSDSYALRGIIEDGLTKLSGSTEQRRGGQMKGATATEASIVESTARVRESDDVQIVAAFVTRGVRRIWSMIQQYGTVQDFAHVVGIEQASFLSEVFQEDFLKRTRVKVTIRVGSMAYVSREIRTKQFMDWVNVFGSKVDPMTGLPVIDLYEAARFAATLLNVPNPERFLTSRRPTGLPGPVGGGGPPGSPGQDIRVRSGGTNMGDLLSATQNVGVRRGPTGPNPRNEFPTEGA